MCLVAPSGECLRGYKPSAADCSRLASHVAASCLAKPVVTGCCLLSCAGVARCAAVIYSLTEIETETEINIISLTKTEMETAMFCETETKYKRNSEQRKRNSN